MAQKDCDIIIIGGGYVGLTMALALKSQLQELKVTLVDPRLTQSLTDKRAFLMATAARRLLEKLDVWVSIKDKAQIVEQMIVTDSKLQDKYRPSLLSFAGEVVAGEAFGHMVEQGKLMTALLEQCQAKGVAFIHASFLSYENKAGHAEVTLDNGDTMRATLMIGSDGASSKVRDSANIQMVGWDYPQTAIVCTIEHEVPHNNCAYEHFLEAGPFATLPLSGNRSSLVWTEETSRAQKILASPAFLIHEDLMQRIGTALGEVKIIDKPRGFPLSLKLARSYISERVALIGDAAHVIHPIAGQGVNLGLKDAVSLCEIIITAAKLGIDYGQIHVLEPYQMARRTHTMSMAAATDGLNRLFSNDNDGLRMIRDAGLSLVNKIPSLKNLFIKRAAGV
jgi:2-octaprenyl-6-methoxyphenol hydroxylase